MDSAAILTQAQYDGKLLRPIRFSTVVDESLTHSDREGFPSSGQR